MAEPGGRHGDLPEKMAALRALATARGLHTLVLQAPATLSWLTGARWHVPHTLAASCFDVVVEDADTSSPSLSVVTNAIEAPRLADTELAGFPASFVAVPWERNRDAALPGGPGVGADAPSTHRVDVAADLAPLRRRLTAHQRERLRSVCADTAEATTAVALATSPAMTEQNVAALYTAALLERGLEPVCLFVAGGQRMARHRHPLPTTAPVGNRVALVCGARRDALIASTTRIVCFGNPGAAGRERYRALLDVEAAFLDATRSGVRIGDVVAAGQSAYPAHGFDADEPGRHHQGGFTGWAPREYLAHPGCEDVVPGQCAVAWNPSAAGWKVEDTLLVAADGVEVLTAGASWPTVVVNGRQRPDLMLR